MNNDYIQLAKEFLIYKLTTFDTKNAKSSFCVIKSEDKLQKCSTIEDIHKECNNIASQGIKQITQFSNAVKKFYYYLNDKKATLNDVDTNFITDYINRSCVDLKLGNGTRTNYKNALFAFCKYLDEENLFDKKFNIGRIKVSSDNNGKENKLTDWLDTKTFKFVNTKILDYYKQDKYKNKDIELEKSRDILIFRLFSFSGILPSEMMNLDIGSFIFEDETMSVEIVGTGAKGRVIPLPKPKLIRYYKEYMKQRDNKAVKFFYSPSNPLEKIDAKYLNLVVKKLLDFTEIVCRDKTPKMLRKTYAILLNNEKGSDGFTQPEKNIQYLLGMSNISQLRELLRYHTIEVMTASKVFDNLEM